MPDSDTVRTALKFVNEINRHDVDRLVALLSDDHLFVDGLGQEVRGRERLREAWRTYFEWFPDYHLGVKEWFQNGRVVGMFGTASGTYAVAGELPVRNRWRTPAAWRAVVREHQLSHWQVYADNEPVWKIMGVKRY
ncbi:MAG: nuclear transport factor 2 family protein [Thermoplasmata archaeon]